MTKVKPHREVDWTGVTNSQPSREVDWGNLSQEQPKEQSLLSKIADALGGGAVGAFQGLGDIGANVAQFPSDVYSYFTGKEGYKAPKYDIRRYGPQSEVGKKSEEVGEFLSPLVSPAMGAEAILGKSMFGGRLLPRLLTDTLLGAAESENRPLGGLTGAALPAITKAGKFIHETPFTKAGAVKNLNKAQKLAGTESLGIPMSVDFLRNLDYQLGSKELKPAKMQINHLLGEAAKGDYPSYFKLQSALGDIGRELRAPHSQGKGLMGMISQFLSPQQGTAVERLTAQQLENLKHQYVADAMKHLEKIGKGKVAKLEAKGKEDYMRYMKFKPTRNKLLIGSAAGIPGIGYLKHLME